MGLSLGDSSNHSLFVLQRDTDRIFCLLSVDPSFEIEGSKAKRQPWHDGHYV